MKPLLYYDVDSDVLTLNVPGCRPWEGPVAEAPVLCGLETNSSLETFTVTAKLEWGGSKVSSAPLVNAQAITLIKMFGVLDVLKCRRMRPGSWVRMDLLGAE